MGHGLGTTQRMILELLDPREGLTVAELAARSDRSPRQIRAAVMALEGRGLVTTDLRQIGWTGAGEYGPLAARDSVGYAGWYKPGADNYPDLPTALTVKAGDHWPASKPGFPRVAKRDTEFVRLGMPTYGLRVWLA
jgi:hypothetical protein